MNCQEFWNSGSEQSSHLAGCPRCSAAWEAEQRLVAALRSAAPELTSEQAPPRVESRLVAALHAHVGLNHLPRRPLWVDFLAWGSAAAAILVLAVFLVRDRAPAPEPQPRPRASELALATPSQLEAVTSENEFIPLPNAAALESDEESNLVRVELSRAAMVAMGFDVEVEDEDTGDAIAADVILGPDGLARAVRFVD